jgi:hypothetical protein
VVAATLAAVLAAGLFAAASALQHRSAGLVGGAPADQVRVGVFVGATLRHRFWLLGTAADLGGLGLHAFALREGPLTVVQPLLVSGLVFALPLRQLLERRRPRRDEMVWAVALAGGLAVFLTSAASPASSTRAPDTIPTLVSVLAVALGVGGCAAIGWRTRAQPSAVFLGIGAGLAFAGTAGLMKQVMDQLQREPGRLLTSWPLYLLLLAGAAGLLLSQLAFRAAPLRASLPAVTVVDPVVSLIIGVSVFDEAFRRSPLAIGGETVGMVVVVGAVFALSARR